MTRLSRAFIGIISELWSWLLKEFSGNLTVVIIFSSKHGLKRDLMYVILHHNVIFSKKSEMSPCGRLSLLQKNKIKMEDRKLKVGKRSRELAVHMNLSIVF